MRLSTFYSVLLAILILTGCQSIPQPAQLSDAGKLSTITSDFKHLAVTQAARQASQSLHVYLEGDGIPFHHRVLIANDPTPRYPFVLEMMKQDTADSVYLGRPCYFNQNLPEMYDARCEKKYWTNARYAEEVIASMVKALRIYVSQHQHELAGKKIILIGHSGGGAIAMLMAARMPEVAQVVTLAGNLDTTAWTELHHYTPLDQSLNPATEITKATPPNQLHYAGSKDDNIPPSLVQEFLSRLHQKLIIVDNFDHGCCWINEWQKFLSQINAKTP